MVKEKRDIRPVLLKFGVAFALSLGGILYTLFKNKKIKPDKSQPPQPSQGIISFLKLLIIFFYCFMCVVIIND